MGSAGLALHPGRPQAECGGHHEGPLAEVWQELLHQVGKVLLTPPILCPVAEQSPDGTAVSPSGCSCVIPLPKHLAAFLGAMKL